MGTEKFIVEVASNSYARVKFKGNSFIGCKSLKFVRGQTSIHRDGHAPTTQTHTV